MRAIEAKVILQSLKVKNLKKFSVKSASDHNNVMYRAGKVGLRSGSGRARASQKISGLAFRNLFWAFSGPKKRGRAFLL